MRIRRTKVTVVKEHAFTYVEHRSSIRIECEKCGAMTRMVRLDETTLVSGASMQEIRRDVEASGLHYTEEANGSFLICLNSLLK